MKTKYSNPKSFSNDFQNAYKKYWDDRRKLEHQIKQLEAEKEKLFYPRLEEQLEKLADTICEELKADAFEISKHGGLSNRVAVWFTKGQPKKSNKYSNTIGYLNFAEYHNGDLALVSNLENDDVIDLKDLTIEQLVEFAKKNK